MRCCGRLSQRLPRAGAKPRLLRLLCTRPSLWAAVTIGPCTPVQVCVRGGGGASVWWVAQQQRVTQRARLWPAVSLTRSTRMGWRCRCDSRHAEPHIRRCGREGRVSDERPRALCVRHCSPVCGAPVAAGVSVSVICVVASAVCALLSRSVQRRTRRW